MISIRRFLDGDDRTESATLLRACSLLMEAAALHAVNHDEVAYVAFRDAVRHLRQGIEESNSADPVLVATGKIIQLIETYNRDVENVLGMRTGELHDMVGMLSRALITMSHESAQAVDNLGRIAKELETASRLDDLRQLKSRLKFSLQEIAKESVRQKKSVDKISARITAQIPNLEGGVESIDPVTRLADAVAAERAISEALKASAPVYLAILCVERLDAINSRFGYAMGDRLMFLFAQKVSQHVTGTDRLFRWRGPTLIAMLERPGRIQDVRIEVSHLASTREEHAIEFQGRTVLLPLIARSCVVSLRESVSVEAVLETLNAFVVPAHA